MTVSDTFLDCVSEITGADRSYLAVRTGHWLRISIGLHLKRQTDLGIPSADTAWDFISLKERCFSDAGISAQIYISNLRNTQGRKTSAKGRRTIQDPSVKVWQTKAEFIEALNELDGIVTMDDGTFEIIHKNREKVISKADSLWELPFGPAIIDIQSFQRNDEVPWNTLLYWGWTFERGEEPMEVEGKHGFSVVSGWKAYARWMQGYMLEPKSVHPALQNLPALLLERRKAAIPYFEKLENSAPEKVAYIFTEFKEIASEFLKNVTKLIDAYKAGEHKEIRNNIKKCYFTEQKTNSVFKKVKLLHHDLIAQRN